MVLTNTKEQAMQQIISNIAILIYPLTVFQIGIVFWVVVRILEKWQKLNRKVKNYNQTRQLDSIYLNTYQNYQIMEPYPLNTVRYVASTRN